MKLLYTNTNIMKNKEKCDKGYNGLCCCNCIHQIELFKHPMNTKYKGSMTESTGLFACLVNVDGIKTYTGIISEWVHGMCEMHTKVK